MKNKILFFVTLLFLMTSQNAGAVTPWFAVGIEARTVRSTDQRTDRWLNTSSLALGLNYLSWDIFLEFNPYRYSDQVGPLGVENESLELLVLGRYSLSYERSWSPFFALGGGAEMSRITSSFSSVSEQEQGEPMWLAAGSLGVWVQPWSAIRVDFELRSRLRNKEQEADLSPLAHLALEF